MNHGAIDTMAADSFWAGLQPIHELLVNGQLATLVVIAVILLVVGSYASKFQPHAKKIGLAFGGLVFVGFLGLLFGRSPSGFVDSIIEQILRGVLVGSIAIAVAWIILTLFLVSWNALVQLILTPFGSFKRFTQHQYDDARYRSDKQKLEQENNSLKEKLAAALGRIKTLENRPDAMPDNFDELTRHAVEWSKQRERILRKPGGNARRQLDQVDATHAQKLAGLLEQQDHQYHG